MAILNNTDLTSASSRDKFILYSDKLLLKGTSFKFSNEWDNSTIYYNDDYIVEFVTHNDSLYVCLKTNKGVNPSNTIYWQRVLHNHDVYQIWLDAGYVGTEDDFLLWYQELAHNAVAPSIELAVSAGNYADEKGDYALEKGDAANQAVLDMASEFALKVDKVAGERLINAAEITKLSNTSNTNTGDETQATIKTKLESATAARDGYLTKEDFGAFNGKQDALGYTPEDVANKSTNISTDAASTTKYPCVKAIKDYADGLVVGLIDDRGSYDASGNAWPTTGGSGTAGAILKGDLWYISVEGTLGGVLAKVGYSIRALVDTPAQTAGNWDILNVGLGYIPENTANKKTTLTDSDVDFPTGKAVKTAFANKNYSVWNRGTVTYSQITGVLTVSDSCYLIFDNRIAVLQGGSGTNLITNFQVHPGSGIGIHVIYCDIPNTGSIGTINIISQLYTSVTALATGFQRLVLGSAYWDTSVYYLSFSGIYEKDLKRLIDLNIANIAANALSTIGVNTRLSNIINGTALITGNDSTFSGAGNWLTALGSPTFNINSTVSGKLYMSFTSGNQCIKLLNKTVVGQSYVVTITARLISGAGGGYVRIGGFSGSLTGGELRFKPTSTETIFTGTIVAISAEFYIGCISTENDGSVYEFDDITLFASAPELTLLKNRVTDLENETLCKGSTFFTDDFLQSLSKYDKPLTKIGICGDSLMANDIGGSIPVGYDEGATKRPIRLTSNQISRRIYDLISWNKATHRRLDDADWTKSGTWTTIITGLFEGGQDTYHTSIESGAYVEITVPSGKENFAFICRRDAALGVINVTINGGDISSYGVSSVDLDRTRLAGADIGNPFHTVLYTGLPSGANVIRISKEANTEEVQIFGGFYWTGNTIVVHNVAHGGHNLVDLLNYHLQADVVENDFDAILFELPLMNEAGHGTGVSVAQTKLQTIISTIVNDKDVCFMGCQPFGTDPTDGTPNYYADYPDPSMEDYNTGLKNILYLNNIPYVDVFTSFKKKIENRGGTLEGGEGGLWYTTDGQHQNEAGMLEYWNLIKFLFLNKPIAY